MRITVDSRGEVIELEPMRRITFGRDPAADLVFGGDPGLSRYAGEIRHDGSGVVIANLSGKHSLFVRTASGRMRLPPTQGGAPHVSSFLAAGECEVTVAGWETSGCRLVIDVGPASPAGAAHYTPQARTETRHSLRLNPATKEFATALVLCRPKLELGGAAPVPSVPELTRKVLEATASWHLLRMLDEDATARARLTGRVHEHLKQLRAKLHASGLAPAGAMAPPVLADVLIDSDIILPAHLALLDDVQWLADQEKLWWSSTDEPKGDP